MRGRCRLWLAVREAPLIMHHRENTCQALFWARLAGLRGGGLRGSPELRNTFWVIRNTGFCAAAVRVGGGVAAGWCCGVRHIRSCGAWRGALGFGLCFASVGSAPFLQHL